MFFTKISYKKFSLLIFLLSIAFLTLTGCDNSDIKVVETSANYMLETKHAKVYIEKDYLTKDEMIYAAGKIEQGIVDVNEYLGPDYSVIDIEETKIQFYIKDSEGNRRPRSLGTQVTLYGVNQGLETYVGETVKILAATDTEVKWLEAGLSQYLQSELTRTDSCFICHQDLHISAKEIIQTNKYNNLLTFNGVLDANEYDLQLEYFNILSGSLVKFIEETYGKESLLRIYNDEDIKDVTGKNFDRVRDEWLNYVRYDI